MKGLLKSNYTVVTKATLLIIACVTVLYGCSSGDEYGDLRKYMADVEANTRGQIPPLPEFEPYQAFTYGTANRRSPFEPPVKVPVLPPEKIANLGVKPPENHTKQYLERFSIGSLTMVGTLSQADTDFALIKDRDGGVHRVEAGDFMGTNWGRIENISDSRIDIIEIVSDGTGGWLRKPRTIELNSEQ